MGRPYIGILLELNPASLLGATCKVGSTYPTVFAVGEGDLLASYLDLT